MQSDFQGSPLSVGDIVVGIYQRSVYSSVTKNIRSTKSPCLAKGRVVGVKEGGVKTTVYWFEEDRTSRVMSDRLAKYGE